MKKFSIIFILSLIFILAACDSKEQTKGTDLPLTLDDIQVIDLTYHTGDPSNSKRRRIVDTDDITYIHNLLASDIMIESFRNDLTNPEYTLYIIFHRTDGTGYKIKYQSFGVKKGILSSEDFTYFTYSDIGWIWEQLTKEYETEYVSIVEDPAATEMPIPEA